LTFVASCFFLGVIFFVGCTAGASFAGTISSGTGSSKASLLHVNYKLVECASQIKLVSGSSKWKQQTFYCFVLMLAELMLAQLGFLLLLHPLPPLLLPPLLLQLWFLVFLELL
jgi:hypothetical protein